MAESASLPSLTFIRPEQRGVNGSSITRGMTVGTFPLGTAAANKKVLFVLIFEIIILSVHPASLIQLILPVSGICCALPN